MDDLEKKDESNLPDPVMDVLKDLQEKVSKIPKGDEKPIEERKAPTVPTYADQRASLQKRMGFTDDQMAAYEESQNRIQAPIIAQTGWSHIEKRSDIDKYRKEIEDEIRTGGYPKERQTPDVMEKIYFMVKGRHADSAPAEERRAAPKPGERVASSRVSGGPGYSGSEGGSSTEKEATDKSEDLTEQEATVSKKLGVDPKRFALARNSGRDITPLRKTDERPTGNGADFDLRRMQGGRR